MADQRDRQEDSFKVFDRRKFTITGEERTDLPPEEPPPKKEPLAREPARAWLPKKEPARQETAQRSKEQGARRPAEEGEPSEEFSALLLSLANTAMVYLEAKDPIAGRSQQNMAASKQMIDWLAALQRKTEGNRTPEESHLLENLLYELRMQFLAKNTPPKL